MSTVISVENLSKSYRLGQIGTGTLTNDLKVWWARKRGLPNPLLKIGQSDYGNRDGETLWALRDVSFTVQSGEVLGIIGRNGAGKSTLLKILSRVTAPTGGCVKVRGRIASLLEVGTGFHPELTGRENISLNGAILGMSRQEIARKFDEIVAFAEVEKFIDTPVKRYSSGMYVRLAFAVAAHLESEILLVDEVLAVGDAEFQKKCLGKMGDVAEKEGRTVFFISHNMGAINQLCENAILLSNGNLVMQGMTDEVISEYLSDQPTIGTFFRDIDTDELRLHDIRIYQEDIPEPKLFVTKKAVNVEFIYEIKQLVQGLRIGFDLFSKNGTLLFRSFDDDLFGDIQKKPGKYRAVCSIPGLFFNSGDYLLSPRITIHRRKWIIKNESGVILSFHNQDGVNSHYDDQRPGLLMPGFEWRTVELTE